MCYPCTALNDRNCRSNMDKKDNHERSASTNRSATKRQSRPSSSEPELLRLQGIGPRAFQSKLRVCFPAGETFNSYQRVPECESILAGFEHSVRTTKCLRANRIYTSTQRHQRTDPNSALATSDPVCNGPGMSNKPKVTAAIPPFFLDGVGIHNLPGGRQGPPATGLVARTQSTTSLSACDSMDAFAS